MKRVVLITVAASLLFGLLAASASAYQMYARVTTYKNGVEVKLADSVVQSVTPDSSNTVAISIDLKGGDYSKFVRAFGGSTSSVVIPATDVYNATYPVAVGGPWGMSLGARWYGYLTNPFGQAVTVYVTAS